MGGIQLDWEIDANKGRGGQHQEDPEAARRRRRSLLRFIFYTILLLVLIALAAFLVYQRVQQVEMRTEQLLRETVSAEVSALRIGDEATFEALQRSATTDWLNAQQASFQAYQELKIRSEVQLTGQVVSMEIEDPRGRAQVQEIIDGVPYLRTWFYWRYEDGWRHVAPDYTFWGEEQTIEGAGFVMNYRSVDALYAEQVAARMERWLSQACAWLACNELPQISIDVSPEAPSPAQWSAESAWQIRLPSPYVDRARADLPFDLGRQFELADLVATRIVEFTSASTQAAYPQDAYFLRTALVSWMVGRFVQVDTQSYLIQSIVDHYGEATLPHLVRSLGAGADLNVLSSLLGVADLAAAELDWRDFFGWRLVVEQDLIQRGDEANWLALYDLRDDALRITAFSRYNANQPQPNPQVVLVQMQGTPEGMAQALATVQYRAGEIVLSEEQVLFRLVNNVWLRAS